MAFQPWPTSQYLREGIPIIYRICVHASNPDWLAFSQNRKLQVR